MCELKISTLRSAFGGLWWVSRFHTLSIYINKLYIYIQYVYIYYVCIYIYVYIWYVYIYISWMSNSDRRKKLIIRMIHDATNSHPRKRTSRLSGDMMYYTWYPKHLLLHGCFSWMKPNHYMKNGCVTKEPIEMKMFRVPGKMSKTIIFLYVVLI